MSRSRWPLSISASDNIYRILCATKFLAAVGFSTLVWKAICYFLYELVTSYESPSEGFESISSSCSQLSQLLRSLFATPARELLRAYDSLFSTAWLDQRPGNSEEGIKGEKFRDSSLFNVGEFALFRVGESVAGPIVRCS